MSELNEQGFQKSPPTPPLGARFRLSLMGAGVACYGAICGIGGGLFAVVPGCMGVAVYSPPLGRGGATARGVKVLRELSDRLDLHLMSARHGDFHRNSDPEP